jgi:Na+-driven multidrug efflux pump
MLQNLIGSFVNMVDTVMIGRLGTVEIAAVGLGNNVFFLYMIILFGICSGGSVFTAQFWGRHDIPGIRKNVGLCLALNLFTGLAFTLAGGCPGRQLIMAGEGDGDAAVFVLGMLTGAAFAHNFSAASSGAGVGPYGIPATIAGLVICALIGFGCRERTA